MFIIIHKFLDVQHTQEKKNAQAAEKNAHKYLYAQNTLNPYITSFLSIPGRQKMGHFTIFQLLTVLIDCQIFATFSDNMHTDNNIDDYSTKQDYLEYCSGGMLLSSTMLFTCVHSSRFLFDLLMLSQLSVNDDLLFVVINDVEMAPELLLLLL